MSTPPSELSNDVRALLASAPVSPPAETARLLGETDIEYGPTNYGGTSPLDSSTLFVLLLHSADLGLVLDSLIAAKLSRSKIVKRAKYYVPSTEWLPTYS